MQGLSKAGWIVKGCGPRSLVEFEDDSQKAFFIRGMRDHGILMNRPNFPCLAHKALDVDRTIIAAQEVRHEMDCYEPAELREAMVSYLPRVLFRNR
jgi:hypothetical protein